MKAVKVRRPGFQSQLHHQITVMLANHLNSLSFHSLIGSMETTGLTPAHKAPLYEGGLLTVEPDTDIPFSLFLCSFWKTDPQAHMIGVGRSRQSTFIMLLLCAGTRVSASYDSFNLPSSPESRCHCPCFTYKKTDTGELEYLALGPPAGEGKDWNSDLDLSSSKM